MTSMSALLFYKEVQLGLSMQFNNIFDFDKFNSMVPVLAACAHLGALDQGKWVHAYIQRNRLRLNVTLGTSLVDMYSKCGSVERAMEVFWSMKERNVFTWNSAISGLAMNGAAEESLRLFELMESQGVTPNGVTFVGLLRGCCVVGLVQKGREMFSLMSDRYKIEPWHEHYGCMIDLLGRAGMLDEAVLFIRNMPIEPHLSAWRALLNSCKMYKLHLFFVRDKLHPKYGEIKSMLGEVNRRLRLAGYRANTKEVLFDIEEEEKENAISWHSKKLAIAFGLIALEEGVELRIVKI